MGGEDRNGEVMERPGESGWAGKGKEERTRDERREMKGRGERNKGEARTKHEKKKRGEERIGLGGWQKKWDMEV